jgi:hypothetical protein
MKTVSNASVDANKYKSIAFFKLAKYQLFDMKAHSVNLSKIYLQIKKA